MIFFLFFRGEMAYPPFLRDPPFYFFLPPPLPPLVQEISYPPSYGYLSPFFTVLTEKNAMGIPC